MSTQAIEQRIDKSVTGQTGLTLAGNVAFRDMNQLMEFAKTMAIASIAIPKHLRENPGACLAVCIQASEWQMSPFAVANKSYSVNDRLAFEAQLINAVILRRAPIIGRFAISYSGSGDTRRCKVSVRLSEGGEVEYESPEFGKITVKNSPLWKSDPDQQLFYFSSRSMCRRHFPDVLLGIYTADEMEEIEAPRMRNATPQVTVEANPFERPAIVEQPAPPVEDAPPFPTEEAASAPDVAPAESPGNVIVGYFEKIETQESKPGAAKPWKLWRLHYSVAGGAFKQATTFSATIGEDLQWLTEGDKIEVEVETGEKGDTIKSIGKVEGGAV